MKQLKGIDLVAGMVIITENGYRYVVFPVNITNQKFAFANITKEDGLVVLKKIILLRLKLLQKVTLLTQG